MPWVILFLLMVPLYGQTLATTDTGRSVILKPDGTWSYRQTVEPGEFTFRKTYWGVNRDEVKATEVIEVDSEKDDWLAYKGEVGNLDTFIIYYFVADKLVKSRYAIVEKHSERNDYIRDYLNTQRALTDKYGPPTEDETMWKNRLYADDKEQFGFAVSIGHLRLWASWETDETEILLRLTGDNYEISLMADYLSKRLAPLREAESKKESLSDF